MLMRLSCCQRHNKRQHLFLREIFKAKKKIVSVCTCACNRVDESVCETEYERESVCANKYEKDERQ